MAIKKEDKDGYYFILPGGGQEHGENLHETLKRECIEEIGEEIEIDDMTVSFANISGKIMNIQRFDYSCPPNGIYVFM